MKKTNLPKRSLAALLALVLALTMVPPAMAASAPVCPLCKSPLKASVARRANCHEMGIVEYTCTNPTCNYYGVESTGSFDPNYHDADYTDNGDGTHSGVCTYHTPSISIARENHTYNSSGVCEKCGAFNYSKVVLNLPNRTIPVALNDADAKLTAGDIKLVLGSADITADYDLSYFWYYKSSQVSTGAECPLPASVYGQEGVYYYTLNVVAQPKGANRQPVSESCTITVQVEELVTASAIISTDETMLRLDEADDWSADPISSQIYEAAKTFCGRAADPYYVTFDLNSKSGSAVGDLNIINSATPYYFSGFGNSLDDVFFQVKGVAGDYSIAFTVYDTAKKSYAGMLTITVQQYVGSMDVLYIAGKNEPVALASEDFEAFWAEINPRGVLDYISFNETPRSVDGALYAGYTSAALPGDRVRTSDLFFVQPGRNEYGIDEVTFLPGVAQSGYITLGFTAYGTRGTGYTSRRDGTMYIFFSSDSKSADVSLSVPAAGAALNPESFQKAYQSATGGTGASFYIQFLDVPASGALYTGRTATKQGVRLTEAAIAGRPFAYNGSQNETISSLTYVPGTAVSESIRYVASSAQGTPLYAGKITFTTSGVTPTVPATSTNRIPYTSTSAGVTFKASDFENLPGVGAPKLNMVSFTVPSATFGTLYWGRTSTSAGTPITNADTWYGVSSTAVNNSVNNITFVPSPGYVGLVNIGFTALNNSMERFTGTVQITVTPSSTTTPGSTNTPSTVKPFPDVPASEWYYTYVMDLASSGIFSGYEDGTFRPSEGITLGQALKLIMMTVGYPDLSGTGSNWAQPFLDRAKADNLLPSGIIEDTNRLLSRYQIAEIAARALKLTPVTVTASPFADMAANHASAPYVMALCNIGIFTGTEDAATKANVFQGAVGIRRKEFAAVIWRMQNYVKTGSASGTPSAG